MLCCGWQPPLKYMPNCLTHIGTPMTLIHGKLRERASNTKFRSYDRTLYRCPIKDCPCVRTGETRDEQGRIIGTDWMMQGT